MRLKFRVYAALVMYNQLTTSQVKTQCWQKCCIACCCCWQWYYWGHDLGMMRPITPNQTTSKHAGLLKTCKAIFSSAFCHSTRP